MSKINWIKQFLLITMKIVALGIHLNAQEIPKIVAFDRDQYQADHQNWMVTSDCNGLLFVANSSGILIFNGFNWQLIPLPNFRKARSVFKGKDCKIYVGGFETFGYIDISNRNHPQFIPIADSILFNSAQEIWNIFGNENKIFFQSFSTLYEYDYSTLKLRIPPANIMFGKVLSDKVFLPRIERGIFKVEEDSIVIIEESLKLPPQSKVAAICEGRNENEILVGTQYNGLFILNDNQLTKIEQEINDLLSLEQINRMHKLKNGLIAIGTILNGLYIIDDNFDIIYHINKANGLSNNTILSLYENEKGDLWVGLDKGINLLKVSEPINYYYDINGQLGTFFCHSYFQNNLYIGTNQGVFKQLNKKEFSLIPGTQGQAWCLREVDNQLFCGLNSGSFVIEDYLLKNIYSATGVTWIEKLSNNKILQSTYTGLSVLEQNGQGWTPVAGFDTTGIILQRFLFHNGVIYGYNPQNQVYIIQLDQDQTKIINTEKFDNLVGTPINSNTHFIPIEEEVFAIMDEYVFRVDKNTFIEVTDNKSLLKIQENPDYISYVISQNIGENVPRFYDHHSNSEKYLLGFNEGFVSVPKNYSILNENKESIYVDYLSINEKPSLFNKNEITELAHKEDNLIVQLGSTSTPDKFDHYEYKLENWKSQWFPLTQNGSIEFYNLPSEEYTLLVRNSFTDNPIKLLKFDIKPIWYKTWKGYLVFLLGLYFLIKMISKRHDWNLHIEKEKLKREKLEELEKERIKSKTEKLERELTHKRKLLANSALTIAQKNKMLNNIKSFVQSNSLSDEKARQNKQKLLHLLEMNLNSDHEWEIFEQNFAEVHDDFLDNLKNSHPDLTSGDLRLAAYIKMGLSSKEIAPLLNISVRSVENKRYRLRKKMDLSGEDNLSDQLMRY